MTAIVDYGVGNLFSLRSSLEAVGECVEVTGEPEVLKSAQRIILPGVGAFGDAAARLRESGLDKLLISLATDGVPIMGICLGMQLLFDKSYEYGEHAGLGLISGEIRPISEFINSDLKIPHIGWNALHFVGEKSPLFKYINEGECVYFVHSFHACRCEDSMTATAEYSAPLTAAAQSGCVYGCQFHPEKSGEVGLKILKAFCELERKKSC